MDKSREILFFLKCFGSVYDKSTEEIMCDTLIQIPKKIPEGLGEFNSSILQICRYVTLRHEDICNGKCPDFFKDVSWKYIKCWIGFLLKPASTSFHFQETRSKDCTFYDGEGKIRPKPISNYSTRFVFPLGEWLKHPENLTIQELELALAIFQWGKDKPVFANWVRKRPYYLDRIHRFLLKGYCFNLIEALRVARMEARSGSGNQLSLDTPAFRAVEHEWVMPRLTGFAAIGLLAIIGLDFPSAFFFSVRVDLASLAPTAISVGIVVLLIGIEWFLLRELAYMDVLKQNRPWLTTNDHAKPRVDRLFWAMIARSLILSLILTVVWIAYQSLISQPDFRPVAYQGFDNNPFGNLVWPNLFIKEALSNMMTQGLMANWKMVVEGVLRFALGVTAMSFSSGLLGFLLQGFWEDTSALEPI